MRGIKIAVSGFVAMYKPANGSDLFFITLIDMTNDNTSLV